MAPLFRLMLLQLGALGRRTLRAIGTPRRVGLFIVGIAVMLLWVVGLGLYIALHTPRSDPERVQAAAPVALLGVCLLVVVTSAGDKAIAFTGGEVDLLFAAPFTRRQLIAYKLGKSTFAAMLTALFLSIVMLRHARWWPACYAGVLLALLFVQLFSINAVMIAQTVGASAWSRTRQVVLFSALLAGVLVARHFAGTAAAASASADSKRRSAPDAIAVLQRLEASPVAHAALAPFSVFGMAMTSRSFGELGEWGAAAAAIDLLLLGLVFRLDATYVEAAIAASGRRYAHLRRIRGGSFLSIGVATTSAWRLPRFPRAGGIGPIVWRQLTSALRSSRGLFLLLLVVALGAGPALAGLGRSDHIVTTFVTVILWLTFLVSTMLKFDFRGDIDHIEVLKSLPLEATALAAGQIVVPTLLMTATHLLLLGTAAWYFPQQRVGFAVAAALALPVNALLFSIENLIFLLFPSRPVAVSPGDFQVLGRQIVVLAAKMVALLGTSVPVFVIAAFAAGLLRVSKASGPGPQLDVSSNAACLKFVVIALVLLTGETLAMLPAIAWAFRRFDVSIDTPG